MPRYAYLAKSQPENSVRGYIEAESEQEAINKLTKMGYFPISVETESVLLEKKASRFVRKIPKKDVVLFTRQLSSMVGSGVNIINGLNIISRQTSNRHFRVLIEDIASSIKDGKSLSQSLSSHPEQFSSLYTSMVHSGESGGKMEETLNRLASFLEQEEEFRNSLAAALTYPAFVFAVGVMTVIVLIGFVIPRLVVMFEDMGQVLPLPTRILIMLSQFLQGYWWLLLAILGMSVFLLNRFYSSPGGRMFCDRFRLKVAVLGDIALKTEVGRMSHTLSLLLSSGMTIIYSLDIVTSVIENQVLKIELINFKDKINEGLSFSQCLNESKLFPPLMADIVTVGEETGNLEKSLRRISDDYARDVDRSLKAISRMLEPVIILVMGLIVGFIVLAMLLPIFQINLMAG